MLYFRTYPVCMSLSEGFVVATVNGMCNYQLFIKWEISNVTYRDSAPHFWLFKNEGNYVIRTVGIFGNLDDQLNSLKIIITFGYIWAFRSNSNFPWVSGTYWRWKKNYTVWDIGEHMFIFFIENKLTILNIGLSTWAPGNSTLNYKKARVI